MGLGGVVVPGTLRDSLVILDAIHARDGGERPETVITDTASYSDIVFGLFAICGYQFSPRIADISDARLWRTSAAADYGPLQPVSNHAIRLDRVRAHWGDMLRVAGSLTLGEVRGHDLIRMLSRDGKPTGLGDAFAHYGRIFKTLHLLQFVSDDGYRRLIGAQLNVTEARHRIARKIFFGQRGELRQHYREGMDKTSSARSASRSTPWCCSTPCTSTRPSSTWPPVASRSPTTWSPGCPRSSTTTSTSSGGTRSPVTRPRARARCATPTRPRR